MRFVTALFVTAMLATGVFAQQAQFDTGVAAEIMRGTTALQAAGALGDNQQLLLNYQVVSIEQAIAQEAVQMGLAERLDVQHALQQARRQILVQARKEALARDLPPPSDKQLKKAYEENPELWTLPAAYKLDVLQLDPDDKKMMKKAKRLALGTPISDEDLMDLNARVVATAASGQWFPANMVVPEIWEKLPSMMQGAVEVFEVNNTVLLIRKGDYRKDELLPFEQVRSNVLLAVRQQQINEAWNDYLKDKRAELGL